MGASSSTAKEPAAVPSPSAAGEAVTVATRAAVGAAGAAVGRCDLPLHFTRLTRAQRQHSGWQHTPETLLRRRRPGAGAG